jgi:hypothetical protein
MAVIILVIIRSFKPYVNYILNGNEKYVNSGWILPKESSTIAVIKLIISNIIFTIMKTFRLLYSVSITLIRWAWNVDDDKGNDNLGVILSISFSISFIALYLSYYLYINNYYILLEA